MDVSRYSEEIHVLKRIAIVVVIFFLMTTLHYSTLINESDPAVFSITLLGFMLILSYNVGKILSRFRLPKLTIYIITGILCGPYLTGFVSQEVIHNLKFVDNLALTLIAFIAGGEMRYGELRKLSRILFRITTLETIYVFILVSAAFFTVAPWLGWTGERDWIFAVVVSMLMGAMLIANSPAVTIGIIGEYRSRGILTETVLGTVVLKDIVVIIVFSCMTSFASSMLLTTSYFTWWPFISDLTYKILGSILMGMAVGILVWLYMRYVGEQSVLFIIGVAFMSYELATYFHFEVLLLGVTAGFWVQNFSRQGETLINHTEESLPVVYPVFFSIAGAKLNLIALQDMWAVALLLVGVRLYGIWAGTRQGSISGGGPDQVTRYAWFGLISQAGVALGLAVIVDRTFPEWGGYVQTLVISVVAINQIIGPVFLKYALEKAGEIPQEAETAAETLIRLRLGDTVNGSGSPQEEEKTVKES